VYRKNPAQGLSLAGRGKLGVFSLREKTPPYGITSFTLSRLLGAIHIHLPGDEAGVVARMVPWRIVIASDVADALTRLLLRGGMLAEPAVRRHLGGRTSEAVFRVICICRCRA
jgi:hypothetical protein